MGYDDGDRLAGRRRQLENVVVRMHSRLLFVGPTLKEAPFCRRFEAQSTSGLKPSVTGIEIAPSHEESRAW